MTVRVAGTFSGLGGRPLLTEVMPGWGQGCSMRSSCPDLRPLSRRTPGTQCSSVRVVRGRGAIRHASTAGLITASLRGAIDVVSCGTVVAPARGWCSSLLETRGVGGRRVVTLDVSNRSACARQGVLVQAQAIPKMILDTDLPTS